MDKVKIIYNYIKTKHKALYNKYGITWITNRHINTLTIGSMCVQNKRYNRIKT